MEETYMTSRGGVAPVGRVIARLLTSYQLQSKFDAANLMSSWKEFVGGAIAKRTKRVSICDRTLFVEMKSAALKHDLNFLKDKLLVTLQKKVGSDVIDKIVLL